MPIPSNTISLRIYDFLKNYPPFSLVDGDRLQTLSKSVVVRYFEAGQTVFHEDDPHGDYLYIVREGSVSLRKAEQLVDVCDEGDLFGVRSMLSRLPYLLTALVEEESLLYAVPIAEFEKELQQTPQVALFFAAGLASGQSVVRQERSQIAEKKPLRFRGSEETFDFHLFELDEIFQQQKKQQLVFCSADTSIQEAAQIMSRSRVGSVLIVDERQAPVGIVTDTDFREKVVTGDVPIQDPVSSIMSSPAVTCHPRSSLGDIQIKLLQHQVHHLCLTEDGSDQSRAVGIITDHDLLLLQANNVTVLIKQAQKAWQVHELRYIRDKAEDLLTRYIRQEAEIRLVSEMITAVNDAIIQRAIGLAEEALADKKPEGVRSCWLSLGSEGRKEQLLRTDQDNALLFTGPGDNDKAVRTYCLELARRVTDSLIKCGFEKCPANIMASNPKWCQSLEAWKQHFGDWISQPDPKALMHAAIFFDFRATYGDIHLANQLFAFINEQIGKQTLFIHHFANNALLNPPPLSFFRNFVVEKSGEHKNEFDIKRRALMPLVDAARVLCYEQGISGLTSTMERYEALAENDHIRRNVFRDAADAYGLLLELRTLEGLRNHDSGRFIDPKQLNKIQRQSLRAVFETIREVQEILRHRFQLDYLRR
jgi:CBS domain-containing protein